MDWTHTKRVMICGTASERPKSTEMAGSRITEQTVVDGGQEQFARPPEKGKKAAKRDGSTVEIGSLLLEWN